MCRTVARIDYNGMRDVYDNMRVDNQANIGIVRNHYIVRRFPLAWPLIN